ncbi:MAG: hypothetical protein ACE5FG_05355 [Myxococcota bacterium]
MPDTVKLTVPTTLKHQSNLGDEVEEISFEAGQEFTVLKEWSGFYLVKDAEGRLFNVKKELVQ